MQQCIQQPAFDSSTGQRDLRNRVLPRRVSTERDGDNFVANTLRRVERGCLQLMQQCSKPAEIPQQRKTGRPSTITRCSQHVNTKAIVSSLPDAYRNEPRRTDRRTQRQLGRLNHAAVHSIWSCEVRQIQSPDAFPDFRDMSETFGLIDQLTGSNIRVRTPNRRRTASMKHGTREQKPSHQSNSNRHRNVLPWTRCAASKQPHGGTVFGRQISFQFTSARSAICQDASR